MSVAGFDCGDVSSIADGVERGHGSLGEVAAGGGRPFLVGGGPGGGGGAGPGGGRGGKAVKASTSVFASSISGPILGKAAASWSRTLSQVAATASGFGWAKMVRNTAATMSLWDFGTRASRLRAKWTRHR